jgi:hypothetical protein
MCSCARAGVQAPRVLPIPRAWVGHVAVFSLVSKGSEHIRKQQGEARTREHMPLHGICPPSLMGAIYMRCTPAVHALLCDVRVHLER